MSKVYVLRSAALPQPLGVCGSSRFGTSLVQALRQVHCTLTDLSKYKPLLAGLFALEPVAEWT